MLMRIGYIEKHLLILILERILTVITMKYQKRFVPFYHKYLNIIDYARV